MFTNAEDLLLVLTSILGHFYATPQLRMSFLR